MRHISRAGHAKRGRKRSRLPEETRFWLKMHGEWKEYSTYDDLVKAKKKLLKKKKSSLNEENKKQKYPRGVVYV